MKSRKAFLPGRSLITLIILLISTQLANAQGIQFSIHADPVIGWFTTDTRETVNNGARPGFAFGLTFDRYFADNYAFSTGVTLVNSPLRLNYADTLVLEFKNSTYELPAGEDITYKMQFITIPLGLKFRTNQIGYTTIFTNIGLDPSVLIGGKADIPSGSIEDENITEELNMFNLGYHLAAGIEYSLGGNTALVFGLGYENRFLDITKDREGQPSDRVRQNLLRFKLGINF